MQIYRQRSVNILLTELINSRGNTFHSYMLLLTELILQSVCVTLSDPSTQ